MAIIVLFLVARSLLAAGDCRSVFEPFKDETELLSKFAPEFIQWVDDHWKYWKYDIFVPIDFDEEGRPMSKWSTRGNRGRIEGTDFDGNLRPVVYAGLVAATEDQWYLVYYYYHAADRGEVFTRTFGYFWGGFHENDMEGGYLVVDRLSKQVVHYSALAHNHFDDRRLKNDFNPGERMFIASEGGKHGAHLFTLKGAFDRTQPFEEMAGSRKRFVHYKGTTKKGPPQKSGAHLESKYWKNELERGEGTPFEIQLLWPIFTNMFDGGGPCRATNFWTRAVKPGEIAIVTGWDDRCKPRRETRKPELSWCTSLRGKEGDRAKFPWGQEKDLERFFDPVGTVLAKERPREGHRPIAIGYTFNPYLQALLDGRVPSWTSDTCPAFPHYPQKSRD